MVFLKRPQVAFLGPLVRDVAALVRFDVPGEDDEVQDERLEDLDVRIDLGSGSCVLHVEALPI